MPSSRGSSQLGNQTQRPCISGRLFTSRATREAQTVCTLLQKYSRGVKNFSYDLNAICTIHLKQHAFSKLYHKMNFSDKLTVLLKRCKMKNF